MKKKKNTTKDYKTYCLEIGGKGNIELVRDVNKTLIPDSGYITPCEVRDEFEARGTCLINDRYKHIDKEAVADRLIGILGLNEEQAIVLMTAAFCDTGDIIPEVGFDERGKGYYLKGAMYDLYEARLVTLYDEAMVIDWNRLAGVIGWYETTISEEEEENKEEDKEEKGEESNDD